MKIYLLLAAVLLASTVFSAPAADATVLVSLIVDPAAANNPSADGSAMNPYNDIAVAVAAAAAAGGGDVIIRCGTYELTNGISITTAATSSTAVTIKPEIPFCVKFNFGIRSAFTFEESSSYITLEGIELDGNTDETDFWCVVAQDFWSEDGNPDGGGLAVIIDGQYITVRDCYLHDCYQKGVEIRSARYAKVEGNIIKSIANTSLSGGHGIMRQQKGIEFLDDDVAGVYRWDIYGNLIFNVEQRIYSWVPSKGFIEMVIDEGKSILIDDPKDMNGMQENMSARIAHNVVAYGAVDHIRLKSTPNLEVSNNSIYTEGADADGITDKGGDTATPQFTNFRFIGNAAQTPTVAPRVALEIDDCIDQTIANSGTPVVTDNYSVGRIKPPSGYPGLVKLANTAQLFVDPNNGDFTINPSLGIPAGVGVDPAILSALNAKAVSFGVTIGWDGWITDNLKLTQTMLDNIPGINDGISGNETVFVDYGHMSAIHDEITFDVVNGAWKAARDSPNRQKFELNPEYEAWYHATATTHLNAAGAEYERIRWGCSEVKQNQVFDADWLTVSQITSASNNTLIFGYDNAFTVDGDLLVDFEGYTPVVGDSWDLIIAGTINSANVTPGFNAQSATDLFDRVLFEGFTPDNYSLEIVNVGGSQAVRLTILAALPVELLYFRGEVISKTNHLLTWETTLEQDNDFFEVQRSADGANWNVIGELPAAPAAANGATYEFTDNAPLAGVNFYRLRQVDVDGRFGFSPIVTLEGNAGAVTGNVFPNPFTDRFVVPVGEAVKSFRIFGIDGRDITGEVTYQANGGNLEVEAAQLPAGSYVIHYNGKVTVAVKR